MSPSSHIPDHLVASGRRVGSFGCPEVLVTVARRRIMRNAGRAAAGSLLILTGILDDRVIGTSVRTFYSASNHPLLSGIVFRSRALYDAEYYAELVERRFQGAVPLLLVGGLLLILSATRASGAVARWLDSLAIRSARRPALMLGAMIVLAVSIRAWTIAVPSTIDWDENTFLTVAQQLSVGELPFIRTLDNKPPLLAAQQSIPFLVGLSHPAGIRFVLATIVGATGAIIGAAVLAAGGSSLGALVGALLLIVGASIAPAGGAWMSHHSANLLLAVLLLLAFQQGARRLVLRALALGGVAVAITLTRTNYVIPAGLAVLVAVVGEARPIRARRLGQVLIGALAVAVAVAAPYFAVDGLTELRYGLFDLLVGSGGRAARSGALPAAPLWLPPLLLLWILLALLWSRPHPTDDSADTRDESWHRLAVLRAIPVATMLGMLLSLALHASLYDHYAGMLMVPLAVQAGLAVAGSAPPSTGAQSGLVRLSRRAIGPVALLSLVALLLSGSSGLFPSEISRSAWRTEEQVVGELASRMDSNPGDVLAFDHHYAYWRTGIAPSIPFAVHPSNIVVEPFWRGARLLGGGSVPGNPLEAVATALAGRPRYLISSVGLTEGYLLEALSPDQLDRIRQQVEDSWDVIWTSQDGSVAIRECSSSGPKQEG